MRPLLTASVPAASRGHTPLFGPAAGEQFTFHQVDTAFELMLLHGAKVPAGELKDYSVHSLRIWLACALLALEVPRPEIKRMVRWRGDESLDIYARINTDVWRRRILASYSAHVGSEVAGRLTGLGVQDLAAYAARFAENGEGDE